MEGSSLQRPEMLSMNIDLSKDTVQYEKKIHIGNNY